MARLVTMLVGMQALVAVGSFFACLSGAVAPVVALPIGQLLSFQLCGLSLLMLVLISFIGWIACRYSIRYLDGEPGLPGYFKNMSFTIGAVGLMVLSADLISFAVCWSCTSLGLHRLLLHYPDRPVAKRAAWTKFIVSRIGDIAIFLAICLYIPITKSLAFSDLAAAAEDSSINSLLSFHLATVALGIAVLTKSVQVPFHTWLPLTMETPTPVSALMHAGVVNAGGFLLVRTAPLLNASSVAQSLVLLVGTATACLASLSMLTQTSIKKKLAYSTISQMGFMLMQCGLGAYSAAMLHILSHSLYKAHEFLSSGSVLSRRAATQTLPIVRRPTASLTICLIFMCVLAWAWLMLIVLGQNPLKKSGGVLLTAIFCAGLTQWIVQAMALSRSVLTLRVWMAAASLVSVYAVCFSFVDSVVAPPTINAHVELPLVVIVLLAFVGLFLLQLSIGSGRVTKRLRHWQVHAANGFYIESCLRRGFRIPKS